MNKIAFYGIAGSGKDYLGNHLVSKYAYQRFSFSDQLKKIASFAFGEWMEYDYPPFEKEQVLNVSTSIGEIIDKTPRRIWLLVNSLRNVEDGLFIRMLNDEFHRTGSPRSLITDVRTAKEADWCKRNGFTLIKIVSTTDIYDPNEFDKQQDDFTPDYVFENDRSGVKSFDKFIREIGVELPDLSMYNNPYMFVPEE
jgi:hypothetical protein